jgi:hypothetical protein
MILVIIEKSWRNYNYMFGFEWLVRKGADNLLKLCKYSYDNLGNVWKQE